MLAVVIEDLESYFNNKNLPLGKNAIQFQPYTQKSEKNKNIILFSYYSNQTLIDVRTYAQLRKTWAKISFQRQDRIVVIIKKQVLMQAIGEG